jgi:hypothetical protein
LLDANRAAPNEAQFAFDWVLDYVACRLGSKTDYVLETPAKCPNCRRDILEKTLVDAGGTMLWTHSNIEKFRAELAWLQRGFYRIARKK